MSSARPDFEPGAVLPSTLAALAGLPEGEAPMLVVNAGREGVTTAIVKAGVLLLHRTVDLGADQRADQRAAATQIASSAIQVPLVDRERSADEWACQDPAGFDEQNDAAAAVETSLIKQEIMQEIEQEIAAESSLAETADEVAQAVSVAAAYFEDTLETPPAVVHAAGTLGATAAHRAARCRRMSARSP